MDNIRNSTVQSVKSETKTSVKTNEPYLYTMVTLEPTEFMSEVKSYAQHKKISSDVVTDHSSRQKSSC